MPKFGLIGRKISHSFSKEYFTAKFKEKNLPDHQYNLYPLSDISQVKQVIKSNPDLKGLNVTIPYKEEVIPYLDDIEPTALAIGAVNVIKIIGGTLTGYNSDFYGFKTSLQQWLPDNFRMKALILGTGGASKAIASALSALDIEFQYISRSANANILTYDGLKKKKEWPETYQLIINTTPLGMLPNIGTYPDINYGLLDSNHYLYDLVYNPEKTVFLKKGEEKGAHIKNGLEMLHLQAEKSWEIWKG